MASELTSALPAAADGAGVLPTHGASVPAAQRQNLIDGEKLARPASNSAVPWLQRAFARLLSRGSGKQSVVYVIIKFEAIMFCIANFTIAPSSQTRRAWTARTR